MNEGGADKGPVLALLEGEGSENERPPNVPVGGFDQQEHDGIEEHDGTDDFGVGGVVGKFESVLVAGLLLESFRDFTRSVTRGTVGRAPDLALTFAGFTVVARAPRCGLGPFAGATGTLN